MKVINHAIEGGWGAKEQEQRAILLYRHCSVSTMVQNIVFVLGCPSFQSPQYRSIGDMTWFWVKYRQI